MIRTDCFYTGRCDIEENGAKKTLYSFSLQDDRRCVHLPTREGNTGGLFIDIEYASADDLRYIQRMVTALVEECLRKEASHE